MTVPNPCSPSPRARWAYVKIERAAGPGIQGGSAAKQRRAHSASRPDDRDLRRHHTIQVKFRGGPEAYWLLAIPGRQVLVGGHEAIYDALTWLLTPSAVGH